MNKKDFSQFFRARQSSDIYSPNGEYTTLQTRKSNLTEQPTTSVVASEGVKSLEPMMHRLAAEIHSLRAELKEKKRKRPKRIIMPAQPFDSIEEFNFFEKFLQEDKDALRTFANATISLGKNEKEYKKSTKSFFQFAKNRQKQRK